MKKGATITGARIIDLAPTILYAMGLPIPDDMDGKILADIFKEEFLGSNIPVMARTPEVTDRDLGYRDQTKEEEIILERLKGLGYVD